MKKLLLPLFACLICVGVFAQQPQPSTDILLYDFEEGVDDWKADWGCTIGGPDMITGEAHHGKSSVAFGHSFDKQQEMAAGAAVFEKPKNFTGFKTLSAWVYFPPKTSEWQAQLYVRSGESPDPVFGKLEQGLKGGWHQITMDTQDIPDVTSVREIGVQVKNWAMVEEMKFHIDQVEVLSK